MGWGAGAGATKVSAQGSSWQHWENRPRSEGGAGTEMSELSSAQLLSPSSLKHPQGTGRGDSAEPQNMEIAGLAREGREPGR